MQKNKYKKILLLAVAMIFIFIMLPSNILATSCCEKTLSGAWCQNDLQENCDPNFKITPTSCDSTSYCKPGCCFDSIEGNCMESTPQRVCAASGGTYTNDSKCQVPQCNLGCCILGDQGAFVTLTRCKQLSGFYGLTSDFRRNIANEVSCVVAAQANDKGACVYDNPELLTKECKFTTRASCKYGNSNAALPSGNATNGTLNANVVSAGFYKDYLCSAEELGTICGPTTKTILIEGKDEVYYQDTCGNPANIYDASRYNDKAYWKKIFKKSESCGAGSSNANSKTCGNCDYYRGSIGKQASIGTGSPTYGNYICIDLSCKKENKKHGESWCVADSPTGDGKDTVGSRYYREICMNGEVITEPCADYRNEICIQDTFKGFSEAACRVNRWQDCITQLEQDDCENEDQRDCMWVKDYYFSSSSNQIEKTNNDTSKGALTPKGLCVPNYPPGLAFWGSSTSSSSTAKTGNFSATTPAFGTGYVSTTGVGTSATDNCALANAKLTVKFTKETKPLAFWESSGDWQCDQDWGNCQYVSDEDEANAEISESSAKSWAKSMNEICYRLGDCGSYINWLNKKTDDGYAAYKDGERIAGLGGSEILEKAKTASTTPSTSTTTGSSTATTASQVASAASTAAKSFTNPTV